MRQTVLPVIAAVAIALSVSATVVSLTSDGSLDVGQGGFGFCGIVRDEGIMTSFDITNRGPEPLTLTSVHFPESRGLRLVDSAIISGHSGIGLMNYPLQGEEITERSWDRRKPVEGYVLGAGAQVDLVLAAGLERDAQKGLATSYVIDYVDASGVARSARLRGFTFYLQDGGECPDDSDEWQ